MPAVMLTEALCWILLLLCCVALVVGWTADYCWLDSDACFDVIVC